MNYKSDSWLFFAMASVILWSTAASAFKITLKYLDVISLVLFSSVISLIVIFCIIIFEKKLYLLTEYTLEDYLYSAVLGSLNPFLYYLILIKAYSFLNAQVAMSLNYTWPIVLVFFSIIFLKHKVEMHGYVGLLLGFTGVFIIITSGNLSVLQFPSLPGMSLALLSSVVWALFWVLNIKNEKEITVKLFYNFLFGVTFLLVIWIFFSGKRKIIYPGLFGAVFIGLFEMSITFILWLKALKMSGNAAYAGNIIYMTPFFSLVCIRYFTGEKIQWSTISGLFLIITGIIIQKAYNNRKKRL